jgi:hypothetical protein
MNIKKIEEGNIFQSSLSYTFNVGTQKTELMCRGINELENNTPN